MSSAQTSRNPRKKGIPQTFILNWQCPGAQGSKPVIRRPQTACEACRNAKVKCNGKQECERCISRGEVCIYTRKTGDQPSQKNGRDTATSSKRRSTKTSKRTSRSSSISHQSLPSSFSKRHSGIQIEVESPSKEGTSDEVLMDLLEPFQMDSPMSFPQTELNDPVLDWPTDMVNQTWDDFNWDSLIDINQTGFSSSPSTVESNSVEFDFFQSWMKEDSPSYMESVSKQALTHSYSESLGSTPDIERASFLSLESQQNCYLPSMSTRNCKCQANLMLRVPDVKRVMEEKPEPRLDKVFRVTGEIIQSCQDIINCASCEISHADLVCIMAVFQHTDKCFDYIAKCDLANSFIKVSVGEYQVSLINDPRLRRMLDLDLVRKARELLSSLRSVGQQLLVSQPGAGRLNKLNLDYLQEVIQNSEGYLRKIMGSFNEGKSS